MMKKLLTVLFALAFTRFAWGDYVSVSTLTSLGSTDWNGAAVYVFAGAQSSQSAINGLVTGWFADGKITQSEIAQFTSADSYFLTASVAGDAGNTSINHTVDDMTIPFSASFSESGTASLYAVAVLVKGDDATYLESSDASWNTYETTLTITLSTSGLTANKVEVANSTASVIPARVQQQYPWNGLVDIELTAAAGVIVDLSATDADTGAALTVETLTLDGAVFTNGVSELTSDSSVLVWDAATDLGDETVVSNATLCVKLTGTKTALAKYLADYMVIDVSGGTTADAYPVSYLYSVPDGGWTDEHKTTSIVMRRIPAGTFTMGSPTTEEGRYEAEETQHEVTLTSDFWVGVFETTQAQYTNLMGSNPSAYTGDTRPVESVNYDTIVGTDGPIPNLIARTGLAFTLPTEAQWEYACRAGTTSALNNGGDATDENMALVGRYSGNTDDGAGDSGYTTHTTVGCYLPNDWGLYDMHGNVYEWCLDWYQEVVGSDAVTDPTGPESGDERLVRGGCFTDTALYCRSAYRDFNPPSESDERLGFRLACAVADEDAADADAGAAFSLDPQLGTRTIQQFETFSATLEELGVAGVTSSMAVKAYGLPKGVKIKKSGGTWILTGTPTETLDGETRCAYVRVTVGGVQTLYKLQLCVLPAEELGTGESEATPECTVGIGAEDDASGVATSEDGITELYQGVTYSWSVTATEGARVTASGLPSGLKVKKVDGAYVLTGTPKKAGVYVAIFKTKLGSVTTVTTEAFTVTALPEWIVGTFDGGGAEGQATLKVSSVGKVSGKWRSGGTNYTASATGFASYAADEEAYTATLTLKKGRVSFTTDVVFTSDDVGGLGTGDLFTVRENVWKSTAEWKSLAKAIVSAGTLTLNPWTAGEADSLTLKFSTSGKVTVKGTITSTSGTTASVSGSSVLCPLEPPAEDGSFTATVTVYIAPSKKLPEGYTATFTLLWDGADWVQYVVE